MIRSVAILCLAIAMLVAVESAPAAVYTVTKTADTSDGTCDADCSLREAITAANATADNDVIVFSLPLFSSPQTITLSGTELVVAANGTLTIYGTGANRLTISGNNTSRILATGANVVVNIHGLRFTGGNGAGTLNTGRGGAIYNVGGTMVLTDSVLTSNSAANGGAMNNAASTGPAVNANLTIVNCVVSNNSSTSSGAALQNFSTSTVHMRNTTVNNNTSSGTGIASAFQANGSVTITNSTFSGNSSPGGTGGGIYYNGTSLIVTNSTFAFNTAGVGGGGVHRTGTNPTANFRNSIIAYNSGAAANVDAFGLITSHGSNIIGTVGTSTGWVAADQQNVDPLLSPLGFHGGSGMTHFPLAASTAINMGDNCVINATCAAGNPPVAVNIDERGVTRPFGASVGVGAVEASGEYYALLPSSTAGVPYNFTVVPANGVFTYSVNSGSLGGLTLGGSSPTTVTGTAPAAGSFNALVHITGTPGQTFHNYRVHVLADPNLRSITGRVVGNSGEPISRAYVTLTGLNGGTYTTTTSGFGYFRIDGVPAGLTGTLTTSSKKGVAFDPIVITVSDVIEGLVITAQP